MADCIVLEGISKSFGEQRILKGISFSIPAGIIYGILGPSGCGKTTTVKIMTGILKPSSGTATVLERRMPDIELFREIGYMAQADAVYNNLTGRENLEFFGMLYGMKGPSLRDRIHEVLNLMGLTADRDKLVQAYSGGMKRRLALAAAILHKPSVLVLDEPTVGLDPVLRKEIWEAFYRMTTEGVTIVVTTHVMDEAMKCDRLALMRNGRLICSGTPLAIVEKSGGSTLEQAFIYFSHEKEEGLHEN